MKESVCLSGAGLASMPVVHPFLSISAVLAYDNIFIWSIELVSLSAVARAVSA